MNYEQATKILDRLRDGWQFSEFVTLRALELTGDYDPERGQRMDTEVSQKDDGAWESQSLRLVANHVSRHCKTQG